MSPTQRRNLKPTEIAKIYGVSTAKVISWIRHGELSALNLAHRGCTRPRYSVKPEALEAFESARQVIADGGEVATPKLRHREPVNVKQYF